MTSVERSETLFDAVGGADGVLRLAHAWHQRDVPQGLRIPRWSWDGLQSGE